MMSDQAWPSHGEVVEVEWVDSASTNGWQSQETFEEGDGLVLCRSTGYLFSKTGPSVKLVQSQSNHGSSAELIAIPRTQVRSIKTLRAASKGKKASG